jgi:uncharacterized protein
MIHKFRLFDTNIVADVNSGAVHVFDDVAYDVISLFPENYGENPEFNDGPSDDYIVESLRNLYSESSVREALEDIKELKEADQLFTADIYKEYIPLWEKKSVIKALCLHICHDCNLRCKYCFASTGDFGGSRMMMSPEVGKKAIDFVIKESQGRKNIEIDFFGGEPLMNFDTVKEIVDYARGKEKDANKHFRFTLTTNALLLDDDKMKYINETMDNVVLSLDGREETNDRMRFRVDGRGSYNSILPKIMKMAELRNQDKYYVRGTFTRENLDFSKDVLHMADLGFKQISVEPVVAPADSGYDIREEDLEFLYAEYERLAKDYADRFNTDKWFNFFHFMVDLSQGPCVAKRLSGCGSGHEYVAVTPDGDVYPCHQFVGNEKFKMGDVHSGEINRELQKQFKNSNIYTKEDCSKCWAKFYCSGGCPANAQQFNGSLDKPYKIACDLEKKRVECSLWLNTLGG